VSKCDAFGIPLLVLAAATGYVDELIEPWETRGRLAWAFRTLEGRR